MPVETRKPGRPMGLKINWPSGKAELQMFRCHSNRFIAEKVGTSIPNVFMRRKRLIAQHGNEAVYQPKEKAPKVAKAKAPKKEKAKVGTPPVAEAPPAVEQPAAQEAVAA